MYFSHTRLQLLSDTCELRGIECANLIKNSTRLCYNTVRVCVIFSLIFPIPFCLIFPISYYSILNPPQNFTDFLASWICSEALMHYTYGTFLKSGTPYRGFLGSQKVDKTSISAKQCHPYPIPTFPSLGAEECSAIK